MRTTFRIIAFVVGIAFSLQCPAQTGDTIFSKGELSTTKNHTGNVWLKELNAGDSTFDYALAVATFEAGAKLDGTAIPVVKSCLFWKALATIRKEDRQYKLSTKGR